MENLRQKKKNIILVDSGDLFFPPGPITELPAGKEKELIDLKMGLYLKAYNLMGYDAFTPGEVELSLGIDELKRISRQAKFSFLLANLLERRAQKPVFKPYIIKEMGGIKIGLLGLTSRDFSLHNPSSEKEKYYLAEPIATAKKIIADLKKKSCKIIIAVAHMPENELKTFAQALPEIHFIISGHELRLASRPLEVNNVEIFMAGSRGENIGRLDFFVKKEETGKRLNSHYQILPLTETYIEHSKTVEMVNQYKTRVQVLLPEAAKTASDQNSQSLGYAIPSFMGNHFCLPCHPQQYEKWQQTGHSRAFQTLAKNNRSSDITCLPCHTTGFKEFSGLLESFQDVQCESCHGPKRGHLEDGKKGTAVSEKQCMICHNPAKSPNFEYVSYLAKVRCPTPR